MKSHKFPCPEGRNAHIRPECLVKGISNLQATKYNQDLLFDFKPELKASGH